MTLVIIEEAFYSSSIDYNLMKEENHDCMWSKRMSNIKINANWHFCIVSLLYSSIVLAVKNRKTYKAKYIYIFMVNVNLKMYSFRNLSSYFYRKMRFTEIPRFIHEIRCGRIMFSS